MSVFPGPNTQNGRLADAVLASELCSGRTMRLPCPSFGDLRNGQNGAIRHNGGVRPVVASPNLSKAGNRYTEAFGHFAQRFDTSRPSSKDRGDLFRRENPRARHEGKSCVLLLRAPLQVASAIIVRIAVDVVHNHSFRWGRAVEGMRDESMHSEADLLIATCATATREATTIESNISAVTNFQNECFPHALNISRRNYV